MAPWTLTLLELNHQHLKQIKKNPNLLKLQRFVNEMVEQTNEKVNAEPKEEIKLKPKAKPKPSNLVFCPDCSRQITYKNLRYNHKCSPEPPPVKKQAKPKAK